MEFSDSHIIHQQTPSLPFSISSVYFNDSSSGFSIRGSGQMGYSENLKWSPKKSQNNLDVVILRILIKIKMHNIKLTSYF